MQFFYEIMLCIVIGILFYLYLRKRRECSDMGVVIDAAVSAKVTAEGRLKECGVQLDDARSELCSNAYQEFAGDKISVGQDRRESGMRLMNKLDVVVQAIVAAQGPIQAMKGLDDRNARLRSQADVWLDEARHDARMATGMAESLLSILEVHDRTKMVPPRSRKRRRRHVEEAP